MVENEIQRLAGFAKTKIDIANLLCYFSLSIKKKELTDRRFSCYIFEYFIVCAIVLMLRNYGFNKKFS